MIIIIGLLPPPLSPLWAAMWMGSPNQLAIKIE